MFFARRNATDIPMYNFCFWKVHCPVKSGSNYERYCKRPADMSVCQPESGLHVFLNPLLRIGKGKGRAEPKAKRQTNALCATRLPEELHMVREVCILGQTYRFPIVI